ncbi:MAG: deoxyribonuclease IV [Bacilli bacterium]|nr:deoxyribonuclease IV [Bacilli bacterium]
MLLIGSHVGYNSKDQVLYSLNEALSYGASTFMFYTGAPQNTRRSTIDKSKVAEAISLMESKGLDYSKVVVHAPYIINLASPDMDKRSFAISFLKQELVRCSDLKISNIVLHPGSHTGAGVEDGLNNIISGLNEVLTDEVGPTILLETMAGKGTELGVNIDQIKEIISKVNNKARIGICLDTCHLNDAGYDVSNFDAILDEIDSKIGLSYVKCIHINDSKNAISSHKDRHANIGFGTIGFDNLISIIYNERLKDIPKILETPYVDREYPPYKYEIDMIKNKKFDPNVIEKIKNN